jgi:hypothetical protein
MVPAARSRATETSVASRSNWPSFSWSASVVPFMNRVHPWGESTHKNSAAPQTIQITQDPSSPIDVFDLAAVRAEPDVHPDDLRVYFLSSNNILQRRIPDTRPRAAGATRRPVACRGLRPLRAADAVRRAAACVGVQPPGGYAPDATVTTASSRPRYRGEP